MSLHTLANHVQSAGRGDDKVLVHMTPGEVGGLQSLAMAHGGSLTINPETGLPEAGFLSRLLPMIAGFALGPAGVGLTAMQAGLATAAIGTAATGSLGRGLMLGLGAYGGAGLGAGLSSMGTATPTAAVPSMNVATTGVEGMKSGMYGGQGIFSQGIPTSAATNAATTTGSAVNAVAPAGGVSGLSAYTAPTPNFNIGASMQKAGMLPPTTPAPAPVASVVPTASAPAPTFDISKTINYNQAGMAAPPTTIRPTLPSEATVDITGSAPATQTAFDKLGAGFKRATGSVQGLKDLYAASEAAAPYGGIAGLGSAALGSYYDKLDSAKAPAKQKSLIRPYEFTRTVHPEAFDVGEPIYSATPGSSASKQYFTDRYTALKPYAAPGPEYAAEGGLMGYAVGGPVETMSAMNAVGGNMMYPQAAYETPLYSNPAVQRPEAVNVISPGEGPAVGAYTGEQKFARGGVTPTEQQGAGEFRLFGKLLPREKSSGYEYAYDPKTMQFSQTGGPGSRAVTGGMGQPVGAAPAMPAMPAQSAYTPPPIPEYQTPEQQLGLGGFYDYMNQQLAAYGGYAAGGNVGGISHLGDYSDGGRLLKGPGDGVSDSIPASIGNRQPARLADGEFVIPARIVSEIGNGSTEAGARKLYAMMDRVQKARRKTVGKNQVARNTKAEKLLPA